MSFVMIVFLALLLVTGLSVLFYNAIELSDDTPSKEEIKKETVAKGG